METKEEEYVNVALDEAVPQHILRTEDDFDSEEEWESDTEDEYDIDGEDFEEEVGDAGWADVMAQILKTKPPEGHKSVVLAKAKRIIDIKPKEDLKKNSVEEESNSNEVKEEPNETKQELKHLLKSYNSSRKTFYMVGRLKPNVLEKNREKVLSTIATKGVVQLFNAVRDQQKKINHELNRAGLIRKEEKIYQSVDKKAFMNMLTDSAAQEPEIKPKAEKEEDPSWNVLRDDFMMGANLKDWDKEPE